MINLPEHCLSLAEVLIMDALKLWLDIAEDISVGEEVLRTTLSMTSRWAAPSSGFFLHHF